MGNKEDYSEKLQLTFTPKAFSKIMHYRHNVDDIEISGHGISYTENLLYIDDFMLVKQICSAATTEFDEEGYLDFLVAITEMGLKPYQANSVHIHTHPGMGTNPSGVDVANWNRNCGDRNFFVQCILNDCPETGFARIMIKKPVSLITKVPIVIDWSGQKLNESYEELNKTFAALVSKQTFPKPKKTKNNKAAKNNFKERKEEDYFLVSQEESSYFPSEYWNLFEKDFRR